jgi:hypothetical protein
MELKKKKGYHRHHIIPKHMGGDDSKENLIYLTPAEHALAHLELYEQYGHYEDAQAFNTLSAQWLDGRSIDGYKQSDEHIKKRIEATDYEVISRKLKGRPSPTKGMTFGPPSDKTKKKISEATKGKPKDNSKGLMGGARMKNDYGNYTLMCIHCREPVSPSRLDRHKNCKNLVK